MSNANAIAAVTATLQSILTLGTQSFADMKVTIQPLDKARGTNNGNQINLFLYMVVRNAAWVNADMPRQVRPGEAAFPPLPLNLYYLVTAFGASDDSAQPTGHMLLGQAMSILHDHPVLSAADIATASSGLLPSDLENQPDRPRVTFHPLSIEELSKLWTGFAMQYRLSAAYEVAVTLIESTRSPRAALPVLTRGPGDQGIASQPNLRPTLPTLDSVVPPNRQTSAVIGDTLVLNGQNLDGADVVVLFAHPLWETPVDVVPLAGGTATSLSVVLAADVTAWRAGSYMVSVRLQRSGETFTRESSAIAVALAPTLVIAPLDAPQGSIQYTVNVTPDVWSGQRVSLLLGDNTFDADPFADGTDVLTFATDGLAAGDYWMRLRIDGVDSLLVDRTKMPPVFIPTQKVTVT